MNGDFLGFSFGNIHSDNFNITHVSTSDRYEETLLPEFEDKIEPIIGNDGNYYFGSLYRTKGFTVSFAFDSVTELQFRKMSQWLNSKVVASLIFDERPYKVYTAKVATPPQISYICFDEPKRNLYTNGGGIKNRDIPIHNNDDRQRTYKGEGTIEFICPFPFAREQFKILDKYGSFEDFQNNFGETFSYNSQVGPGNTLTTYTNINEWAEASGILTNDEFNAKLLDRPNQIDDTSVGYNYVIPVYNPGDIETPFYLFLPFENVNGTGQLSPMTGSEFIDINYGNNILRLKPIESKTEYINENGIMINTRNHLIEGVVYDTATFSWRTTGNLYNEYIKAGDFEKIKCQDWSLDYRDYPQSIYINCATGAGAHIHYNYLYY